MAEENEIIQLSMRFRSALIRQDEAALARLVSTYQRLYGRLQDKIDKLVDVIALEEPTAAQLSKMVRYRQLMRQIQDELGGYQNYVKAELEQIGAAGVEAGLKDARQMVQFVADGYGIQAGFNNLPKDAIETMLGFLQEDGPLYKRLGELAPTTTDKIADALLEGVGLGYGPRKTARDIVRQQLGLALTDSLRMVRTVQLWSYREATRASYIANDHIVQGWIWHANLDGNVCMSCVAMHGTEHPVTETLNDHHNGRCAMIPIVPGMDKDFVVPESGKEWFDKLPEEQQQKMMGKKMFERYNNLQGGGKSRMFRQLSTTYNDNVYGTMRRQATYKELWGERERLEKLAEGAPKPEPKKEIEPEITPQKFVPAKTREEAIERLDKFHDGRSFYAGYKHGKISGVNFEGLKLEELNKLLHGVEDVSSRFDVKYSYIGFQWKRHRYLGTYWGRSGPDTALAIQKTFLNNPEKVARETAERFAKSTANSIKYYKDKIGDATYSNLVDYNKEKLSKIEKLKRWAIYSEPGIDPVEATARHEAYHGVYWQKNLTRTFSDALNRYGVTGDDWLEVSEYGSSKITELFSEAATAIDMGVDIPTNIRSAVIETLESIR